MKYLYRTLFLILLVSSVATVPGVARADCTNPNSGATVPNNSDGTCPSGFTESANAPTTIPSQGAIRCQNSLGNSVPLPADGNCPANYPTKIGVTATGQLAPAGNGNLTYTPLEPLSSDATQTPRSFCDLLSLIFRAFIYVGGMVAVLYLVIGGITYMISEVVDKRSKARDRIKAAVWGLIILLCSWLLLNTINPQLIKACISLNPADANGVIATNPDPIPQARQQCQNNGGTIQKGSVTQMASDIRVAAATGPIGTTYVLLRTFFVGSPTETAPGTCGSLSIPDASLCSDIQPGEVCIKAVTSVTEAQCNATNGQPNVQRAACSSTTLQGGRGCVLMQDTAAERYCKYPK